MRRKMTRLAVRLARGAIADTWPPRRMHTVVAICAAFIAATTASATMNANAASTRTLAQTHWAKDYPELMENWGIFGPIKKEVTSTGIKAEYVIGFHYGGGESVVYHVLGKKDIIPAMWSQLLLSGGVTLLKDSDHKTHFTDAFYRSTYHKRIPKTNLQWHFVKGVPMWKNVNVSEGNLPRAVFWISGQPGQCFKVTAQGRYRHKKRWVRIAHAPVQTAQACLPGTPPTTTTTG